MEEVKVDRTKRFLKILYKNWKGDIRWRDIEPQDLYWGNTEFHPEPQWLLDAFDLDKDALRTFAFKDIILIQEYKEE